MFDVRKVIKTVYVNSSHFDFITRASQINQIMEHKYFFLAGDSTRRHRSWRLLNRQFLIVPINCVNFIHSKRAFLLTHVTGTALAFRLIHVRTVEGTSDVATFTFEEDLLELREHTGALRNNTTEFNQRVQVHLSQLTKLILDGKFADANMDFLMNGKVVRVDFLHDILSHRVQDWKHQGRLFSKPNGQSRLF